MPIIINGGSRRAGGWWAKHLTDKEQNERAELVEMRGVTAESVEGAFDEMRALATGTKCSNYFYQANINPRADEHLTPEQWVQAVDTLERNLGLTRQPRFVMEHEKAGRTHRHVVWSRIDVEHQRAIPDSLTAQIHEQTSRELEIAFDLERGKSILVPNRDFERPERGAQKWETFRGQRHGIDPRAITEELTGLWQGTDSGQSFKTAIEERGYVLAQGDRRDFVVLDEAGDVHSLARRIEGTKAKDIRERFADLDRAALPSVDEAKAQIEARRHAENYHDRDAADAQWQSAVNDAGIAHDAALTEDRHAESEPVTPDPPSLTSEVDDLEPASADATAEAETFDGPSEDPGGDPLRGISRVMDGVTRIAENVMGLFDGLTGGSPQPAPQPEKPPPIPEPQPLPVAEFPRASAPLDADARREAVLRAIAEMESALRQGDDRRDREAGRELGREREISR